MTSSVQEIDLSQLKWFLSIDDTSAVEPKYRVDCQRYTNIPCESIITTVHTTLYKAGLIDHPYQDYNELRYQWISHYNWTFHTSLDTYSLLQVALSTDENKEFLMICEGIDTIAQVCMEDQVMFTTDNAFRRYMVNIMPYLKEFSINRIVKLQIKFQSPIHYAKLAARKHPYEIPCPEYTQAFATPGRNFIRKSGCDFGWDWGPCFASMGVHRYLRLVSYTHLLLMDAIVQQKLSFIDRGPDVVCEHVTLNINCQFYVYQSYVLKFAKIRFDLFAPNASAAEKPIVSEHQIVTFSSHGLQELKFELTLHDPQLWWPNGYGKQPLYKLRIEIEDPDVPDFVVLGRYERRVLNIGVRQIELDTSRDEYGNKFSFKVNTVPIYAKGSNWIPSDCFNGRVTRQQLAVLLQSASDCNMNFMRVWGGGVYESDEFYNLCDELGILIWQDMMFACALYPATAQFLQNVKQEITDQIWRIQHHSCIALYAGNNENEEALYSWPEVKASESQNQLIVDYSKLYVDCIYGVISTLDPSRAYWPSSPSNGLGVWGNPQDLTRGDAHYWGVWHGQKPFSEYLTITPRFSSEFGFQSIPSLQTLHPFLTDKEDFNLTSPSMEFRQRSFRVGNKAIVEHISRQFKLSTGFEETIYLSQVLQALSIKTACEHWRRQKKICAGAMYWQLNDIWPGTSWSSIEWNSRWKLLQYFSKKFFAPTLLSVVENKKEDTVEFWLTSDVQQKVAGRVNIQLVSYQTGEFLKEWSIADVSIAADGSRKIGSIQLADLFGESNDAYYPYASGRSDAPFSKMECFILCQFISSNDDTLLSENFHFFCPLKFVTLRKPKYRVVNGVDNKSIQITADQVSLFVCLHEIREENDTVDLATVARFSDNGFILLPNVPKTVSLEFTQFSYDRYGVQLPLVYDQPVEVKILSLRDSY